MFKAVYSETKFKTIDSYRVDGDSEVKHSNQSFSIPGLETKPRTTPNNRPQSAILTARYHSAATPVNDPYCIVSREEIIDACKQHNKEDTSQQASEVVAYRRYLNSIATRAINRQRYERELAQVTKEIEQAENNQVEIKQQESNQQKNAINKKKERKKYLALRVADIKYMELVREATKKSSRLTKEQMQLIYELMKKQVEEVRSFISIDAEVIADVEIEHKNKLKQFIIDFDLWGSGCLNSIPVIDLYADSPNQLGEEYIEDQYLFFGKRSRIKPWVEGFIVSNVFRLAFVRLLQELNSCNIFLPGAMNIALHHIGFAVGLFGCGIYGFRLSRNLYCGFRNCRMTGSTDYFWRHKHEILNDIFWVSRGVIGFGMTTGLYLAAASAVLGPGGIILSAALYAFDLFNVTWQYYSEIREIDTTLSTIGQELRDYRLARNVCHDKMLTDSLLYDAFKTTANNLNKAHYMTLREFINDTDIMSKFLRAIATGRAIVSEENVKLTQVMLNGKMMNLTDDQVTLVRSFNFYRQQVIYKKSRLDRLPARKRFLHVQGRIRMGAASGYSATISVIAIALTVLATPVAPVAPLVIASTFMLAVCATEFYIKRVYLPRKEVELAYNPADLLHDKLLGHVTLQLQRLKENKRSGNTYDRRRTAEKVRLYKKAREALAVWQVEGRRQYGQLPQLIGQVIQASMMERKTKGEPSSAKHLRKLLSPFAKAEWNTEWKGISNSDVRSCIHRCLEAMQPLQLGWKKRCQKLSCSLFSYKLGEARTLNTVKANTIVCARFHHTAVVC
ncbi:MAG: hypothetical protein P1U63_10680 [Coxiellaceae bacterium]|nr:hypothetical protein [Coxiellaceae bacterium]